MKYLLILLLFVSCIHTARKDNIIVLEKKCIDSKIDVSLSRCELYIYDGSSSYTVTVTQEFFQSVNVGDTLASIIIK